MEHLPARVHRHLRARVDHLTAAHGMREACAGRPGPEPLRRRHGPRHPATGGTAHGVALDLHHHAVEGEVGHRDQRDHRQERPAEVAANLRQHRTAVVAAIDVEGDQLHHVVGRGGVGRQHARHLSHGETCLRQQVTGMAHLAGRRQRHLAADMDGVAAAHAERRRDGDAEVPGIPGPNATLLHEPPRAAARLAYDGRLNHRARSVFILRHLCLSVAPLEVLAVTPAFAGVTRE